MRKHERLQTTTGGRLLLRITTVTVLVLIAVALLIGPGFRGAVSPVLAAKQLKQEDHQRLYRAPDLARAQVELEAARKAGNNDRAYAVLAGLQCEHDVSAQGLSGKHLTSGVYCAESTAELAGPLVLDAVGRP